MYCPRCSAENRNEQKYCRGCGLALPGVRMALEGRLTPGIDLLKKDYDYLAGGVVTLAIFVFIALISFFFDSSRNWSIFINLLLGLLIAGPIIYRGLKRVEAAIQRVDPAAGPPPAEIPTAPRAELPTAAAAFDTDPLAPPASVTEDATQQLPVGNRQTPRR